MFSILGAIAGYELQGIIVSIATSFIGSYLTIRSLSVLFGGFPNEFDLGHRLQTGVYDELKLSFYIYLALILILFVCGFIFQMKLRNQRLETIVKNEKLVSLIEDTENKIN